MQCNFLVIKDLWEGKTYPEMVGTKEGKIAMGEIGMNWQEGYGEHSTGGNQWTWLWKISVIRLLEAYI